MTGEDVWFGVGVFAQLTDRLPNPILLDTFTYYTASIQYTENVMVFIYLFLVWWVPRLQFLQNRWGQQPQEKVHNED